MLEFWTKLHQELSKQQSAILLIVAAAKGSCPGKPGFKMAVFPDGLLIGTIGGGKLEFDLVEDSKNLLTQGIILYNCKLIIKEHYANGPRSSGMSCAGTQSIIQTSLTTNQLSSIENCSLCEKVMKTGSVNISQNGLYFTMVNLLPNFELKILTDKDWSYSENVTPRDTVYIIGAGHVGLALSELMKFLDFRVILFDHRDDINTIDKNTFYDSFITGNYQDIARHIPEDQATYVVIVSHSHESDQIVFDHLLEKQIKYLGLMGSKAKIRKIFNNIDYDLRNSNDKHKVYTPIGIKINSLNSKEIAISIAAEIISVKNDELVK